MDPQQRQLLECAYEALENAGFPKTSIAGSNMGVFVGARSSDYRMGTLKEVDQVPMYDATACSSSLYALHSAVQSMRSGESDSAIVAGCNLHLQPDDTISMSMMGLFNDDGKTFAFDHRAKSGFARGEGVACLILKPLGQALKDRDKIRSIIVGSGTNHDGKTSGIAAPSGDAQERLMRDVYARAQAGDPVEAGAIYRVFGDGRTKRSPLYMGSSKTNFGHLENVSGIVSIIKATLMLEKGFILPNVNFEKANEAIPLDEWNIEVPVNIHPWPKDKRFISINNFGFGGSNAHVILERAPVVAPDLPQKPSNEFPQLVVLSANEEGAAQLVASHVGVYVEKHPEACQKRLLRDIAYTLGERRSLLPWRVAIVTSTCNELGQALNGNTAAPKRTVRIPKLAFVYTGQGAQWAKMGYELLQSHPVFADTIEAASDCLGRLGAEFSIVEEISKSPGESGLGQAHISQPTCTAIQLGLTALLSSWGIKPSIVVGHSSGEIGAAFAAGAISLEDAMAVAYHRGQLSSQIKIKNPHLSGAMLAVGARSAEVNRMIKLHHLSNVTVACENSPNSVTVSGDEASIDALAVELEKKGLFQRKLRVDVAYHSSHMQVIADEYMAAIKHVTPRPIQDGVRFYSALKGRRGETSLGPDYWVKNLTNPVLFSTAIVELCAESEPNIVVEIGPHSALEGPIKQILKSIDHQHGKVNYFASLVRNKHSTFSMLQLAGNLFMSGARLEFCQVNQTNSETQRPALLDSLTPYPWSEHKYWYESRASEQHRKLPFPRHDLLGRLEDTYNETEPVWRNVLSSSDVPWIKNHRMQSFATFPLAGYLSMAVEAASQRAQLRGIAMSDISGYRLREIRSSKALILDDDVRFETVLSMRAYGEGTRAYSNDWDEFTISSWVSSRGWLEHCRGLINIKKAKTEKSITSLKPQGAIFRRKQAIEPGGRRVSLDDFYAELGRNGACYTSSFTLRPEAGLTSRGNFATSTVAFPDTAPQMPFSYETPSILPMASLFMPLAIKEIDICTPLPNQAGQQIKVVAHGRPDPASLGVVDFCIDGWHSDTANPVIRFAGFRMTPVSNQELDEPSPRSLCYKLKWEPLKDGRAQADGTKIEPKTNDNAFQINGLANEDKAAATVIISDKDQSDRLVSALLALIARAGSKASICPLSKLEPSSSVRYICLAEMDAPLIHNMTAATFARVQRLLLHGDSILWVTAGAYRFAESPHKNMAQGLLRTVRSESGKVAAMLDLDVGSRLGPTERAKLIMEALSASQASKDGLDGEFEFAEQEGLLVVPRVVCEDDVNLTIFRETLSTSPYLQDFEQSGRRLKVVIGNYGAIDSLYWTDEAEFCLDDEEIEIKVAATGMNFKDVVISMGQVPSPYLGVECSGIATRVGRNVHTLRVGDRVCAMVRGAYGTYATCHASSAAVIPADMSFPVAASLPVVYSTAYYGITELARMQPGEKILIHAASGGVGQAAIQLSQMIGADIYATVSSADKKQLQGGKPLNQLNQRVKLSRLTAYISEPLVELSNPSPR
ncbi:acyl transferase domain-containing protein [Hirsutella rhossiliensis]|uniref:Acyl transferase domain-containing protein n=1 Tax=Hirsutella rhossiliensis TaxID=111463 RepID=A0A9P8N5Y8_9HYPO|nr:acyl transferase domain-containing protein [Hirsutella rhossiliensis]KAH0967577.1 acyl transferase domain-containing protein [Hirsutella rhossiliensis]